MVCWTCVSGGLTCECACEYVFLFHLTSPALISWCSLSYPFPTNDLILNSSKVVYPTIALINLISISIFGSKTVVLCYINNLFTFLKIQQLFQYRAESSSSIQPLQDWASLSYWFIIHILNYVTSNTKPNATHVIKSIQNNNINRSSGSKTLLLLPLVINATSQFTANEFHNLRQSIADSIVAH